MRNVVCLKCKKEQNVSIDNSCRAIVDCVHCGARLKAVTNKRGRLSIEEMEAGEDIIITLPNQKLKPSGS